MPHFYFGHLFFIIDTLEVNDFSFWLLSPVYSDSLLFSLSFNVTNTPPTLVSCSINGNQFNISNDDLLYIVIRREDPIIVQVSVLVRVRVAGLYQCSVTTNRITNTSLTARTPARNITGKNTIKHYLLFFILQ